MRSSRPAVANAPRHGPLPSGAGYPLQTEAMSIALQSLQPSASAFFLLDINDDGAVAQMACARTVASIMGRRAARQSLARPNSSALQIDPPPGFRVLLLGFARGSCFHADRKTRIKPPRRSNGRIGDRKRSLKSKKPSPCHGGTKHGRKKGSENPQGVPPQSCVAHTSMLRPLALYQQPTVK